MNRSGIGISPRLRGAYAAAVGAVLVLSLAMASCGGANQPDTSGGDTTLVITENHKDLAKYEDIYAKACIALHTPSTATQGYSNMMSLSMNVKAPVPVRYKAKYLCSRICFESGQSADTGNVPDSIRQMQTNLGRAFKLDNKHAHELLLEAVEIYPDDYHSQYDLGCDYKSHGLRGTAYNRQKAVEHLTRAETLARKANDQQYMKLIQQRLSNLR